MSKYSVNVARTEVATFIVEADSEYQAREIAEITAYDDDFNNAFDVCYEIGTITKLEDSHADIPPVADIVLGGYGYLVARDGDGIYLTRLFSACTDCGLKDRCPKWVYEPGLVGTPNCCKATTPKVAATYDIYHLPVREDYPEWSDDEFKSIVELYKRRNEL